jgi:hypothetical protein
MGRYSNLQSPLFAVFDTDLWKAEKIATYPSDFSPSTVAEEFIRITVIPANQGINLQSLSGICQIEIYTAYGDGGVRAYEIADKLDNYLLGMTLDDSVQFSASTMVPKGRDAINAGLSRYQYSIPFNLYGVY